jgi:hypothetical protein
MPRRPADPDARRRWCTCLASQHGVITAIKHMRIEPKQITVRSPRESGFAERFVTTARSDLLDNAIVLKGKDLQRLLACFASYYLNDRTHSSPKKDAPAALAVEPRPGRPPRSPLCRASASFIIATLGAARPGDRARPVHRRGLVAERVCSCGRQTAAFSVNRWA